MVPGKNGKAPLEETSQPMEVAPEIEPVLGEYERAPASPQEDTGFLDAVKRIKGVSARHKKHPPAKLKSQQAQAASETDKGVDQTRCMGRTTHKV